MRTLVYQSQPRGCGFAVVKMALISQSKDRRYAFLPEPRVDTSPDLATIIAYAGQHGLTLRAYETPFPEEVATKPEFPSILLLREENRVHTVYLASSFRHRFLLLDPDRGKRWVNGEELMTAFTGVFLRIEGYEKKSEEMPLPPKRFSSPFGILLALLPFVWLFLGLLGIDLSWPSALSLLFVALSLLSSAMEKAVLAFRLDRFDSLYLDLVDEDNLKRRRDLFVHYQSYKRAAFLSLPETLGHAGSLLAALLFFFLHDLYLAASCAVMVVMVTLYHLLFGPYLEQIESRAAGLEANYFQTFAYAKERKEMREGLRMSAKRYARILSLKEFVVLGLSFSVSALFCLSRGSLNTQTILFYVLSGVMVSLEADKLFECHRLYEQKKKEEPYFCHNILSKRDKE